MKQFIAAVSTIAISFAATMLVGCEDKPTAPAAAPTTTGTPAPAGETSKPADPAPAPAPAAAAHPQSTPAGAVDLFIASMQKRDFETALLCLDPACEAHKSISGVLETVKTNPNLPAEAQGLVTNFLTLPFVGMTHEGLQEDGDRARVTLLRKDLAPLPIDMNKLDGKWYLIAPDAIISVTPATAASLVPPAPAGTPAGTPAPAPAPAPAPSPGK